MFAAEMRTVARKVVVCISANRIFLARTPSVHVAGITGPHTHRSPITHDGSITSSFVNVSHDH